ncbi:MAG: hypothetical protein OXC40_02090 [Proteobacteria bacterium]|nr:hypothetical protein [Pseudomonadota bacterium]
MIKMYLCFLKFYIFHDHPEVKEIKKNNQEQYPTNVVIQIIDYTNTVPPKIDGLQWINRQCR